MIEVLILLVVCSIMGVIYSNLADPILTNTVIKQKNKNAVATILFVIILCTLVCFSGLRTRMNDTATYIAMFDERISPSLSSILDIDWLIGNNPLFKVYQILLKVFISESSHVFIFVTSSIVTTSMLMFLKKYSLNFGYSLFLFLAFFTYAFTMAAMKQTFATAIAIWALPEFLKGKNFKAAIIILFAMLFHPYVVIYFVAFFSSKTIWDKKTFFMIVVALAFALFYETFLTGVLGLTASIGNEYELEYFTNSSGVNPIRILIYMVTPVLSFIYRKTIQNNADDISLVAINFSVVSAIFMTLASLGAANMFGRMANYFDIFTCLALPVVFKYGIKTKNEKLFMGFTSVICFTFFYYMTYSRYSGDCFYDHISFLDMLKSW